MQSQQKSRINQTIESLKESYDEILCIEQLHNFRDYVLGGRHYTMATRTYDANTNNFGTGRRFGITIGKENAHLIENPMLLIKLENQTQLPVNFKPSDLIKTMSLEIDNETIDKIWEFQLEVLLELHNLEWKYLDDHVIIPLPFDLFHGKNSFLLKYSNGRLPSIHFMFELGNFYGMTIKNIELKVDLLKIQDCILDTRVFSKIKDCIDPCSYVDQIKQYISPDQKLLASVMSRSQFTGSEFIAECGSNKFRLGYDGDLSAIYFMFVDENRQIITDKVFNEVSLKLDSHIHYKQNFASLLCDGRSHLDMAGVYYIPFSKGRIAGMDLGAIDFSDINTTTLVFDNINRCGIHLYVFGIRRDMIIYYKHQIKLASNLMGRLSYFDLS